ALVSDPKGFYGQRGVSSVRNGIGSYRHVSLLRGALQVRPAARRTVTPDSILSKPSPHHPLNTGSTKSPRWWSAWTKSTEKFIAQPRHNREPHLKTSPPGQVATTSLLECPS